MIKNSYGENIYTENDVLDMLMQGIEINNTLILIDDISTNALNSINNTIGNSLICRVEEKNISIQEYDSNNQKNWFMPDKYKTLDIAEYVLTRCNTQEELQRCGEELLMYQERDLFDLLRYMVYLVDTMTKNDIVWGVGRGSSVSSYVLYKLKVHKINSMFYNLDVSEFLR